MTRLDRFTRPLLLTGAFLLMAAGLACQGDAGRDPILGTGGGAVHPPTVIDCTPDPNTTGVTITNPVINATFSEPMSPITGTATFTVTGAAPGVSPTGTVALDSTNRIATFTVTPGFTLTPLNVYTATITGAKSLSTGLALASPFSWSFTTGPIPDTTRPRVTLTVPVTTIPGPTLGVPFNTAISATFTEDMALATINATSFTVTSTGGIPVAGGVSYASRTAVFAATGGLVPDTTYTATITTAATDLAGNALAGNQAPLPAASNYIWTFRTGPTPDTTRPRVTLTVPATTIPGPTPGVPINTAISAAFTEDMAPATLNTASFTLTGPGAVALTGGVFYASRTAVFTPAAALLPNTTYTARVTQAATDLAGNALAGNQLPLPAASDYVWTFTTGPLPDTTRPRVTFTVPVTTIPGPTNGVAINTAINASFTEDMAPATLNITSFTVTGPDGLLTGGVSYASRTAIFLPSAILTANTTYTARVTMAATDLAGNALAGNQAPLPAASDYVWTFRTGITPDTTRPRVILTVPATTIPGPTLGVPANTAITAVFSEDMDPGTITTTTFTVTTAFPGVDPVGNVSYTTGSRTAVFVPSAPLAGGTTYTATITMATTDLAGNALAGNQIPLSGPSDYVWTFTTTVPVPPSNVSVQSTNPGPGALGVCPDASINATFTVPSGLRMDPATVNAATFTVTGPGPLFTPVTAASVTLDVPTGQIATFTPGALLTVGVTYTATLKGTASGVKDLAIPANTMVSDYTWTFTVGACVPPPNPSHLGTAAGFGIMATSAITSVPTSHVDGDVSLEPGSSCGLTPVEVNGTIHINDSVSHQALLDLNAAYVYYTTLPPGVTITAGADLGALYPAGAGGIPPGTYTSGSTMNVNTPLVLNAGGNANAIWVFQIGSSLTTTTPLGNVTLLNGANPNNVFWVCTASATIGVGNVFNGTIIAGVSITAETGSEVFGRLLAGAIGPGTIALQSATIHVPAP
ncbi:MAG: Ig-like domain-containing protein [Holophagaceae bacterium]|nr:Ig-like domain-containing protein [Holophagaceae bacterium]